MLHRHPELRNPSTNDNIKEGYIETVINCPDLYFTKLPYLNEILYTFTTSRTILYNIWLVLFTTVHYNTADVEEESSHPCMWGRSLGINGELRRINGLLNLL